MLFLAPQWVDVLLSSCLAPRGQLANFALLKMSDDIAEQQPQAQPSQDDLRQMIRDEIAAALRPSRAPPHRRTSQVRLTSCVAMSLTLALSSYSSFARLPVA